MKEGVADGTGGVADDAAGEGAAGTGASEIATVDDNDAVVGVPSFNCINTICVASPATANALPATANACHHRPALVARCTDARVSLVALVALPVDACAVAASDCNHACVASFTGAPSTSATGIPWLT
ncbi:hypothetical protein SAMN05216345_107151 [Cupriavidus sp. YR651]|nr:hypothetical protein SAMN05216345_107151 [Cupriavidus sp. YR651]